MRIFNFFISDDRYTVPTLAFVTASDTRRALELAMKQLEDSPHHLAVEVLDGDEMIARLDRDAA